MYLLIVFLPLIAFLSLFSFGRFFGKLVSSLVAVLTMGLAFILSLFLYYEIVLSGSFCQINLGIWAPFQVVNIYWIFTFDTVVALMLNLVLLVSFLVHVYSLEYMSADPFFIRFISYLLLFTFCMVILVTGGTLVQMFFGWEGVGLSSYLLINFWFTRIQANKAAIKAMLINRVGDFGLALGLFAFYSIFRSLDYTVIFLLVPYVLKSKILFLDGLYSSLDLICILVFVGVMAKSAQLGLHVWLPDAMEGPTPVSALIHAATMVTAGVFLIIRLSFVFEYSNLGLIILTVFGSLTAFVSSTIGAFQHDLKKIIAYSTCSQLGYMVFSCGLSMYSLALFHLFNHGFFKALLFLSAGSVIHGFNDNQDIRKMGALVRLQPLTYLMILVGSMSLAAIPTLSGFYSKDLILEVSGSLFESVSMFSAMFGYLAAIFTVFYSYKLIYLTFLAQPNGYKYVFQNVHEPRFNMMIGLIVLFFFSIVSGYFYNQVFNGFYFFQNAIFVYFDHIFIFDFEFFNMFNKKTPILLTSFTILFCLFFFNRLISSDYVLRFNHNSKYGLFGFQIKQFGLVSISLNDPILLYNFFSKKWFFDLIYNFIIFRYIWDFAYYVVFRLIDKVCLEWLGLNGFYAFFIENTARGFVHLQSGFIFNYVFLMVLWVIFGILFISFVDFNLNCVYIFVLVFFIIYLLSKYDIQYDSKFYLNRFFK